MYYGYPSSYDYPGAYPPTIIVPGGGEALTADDGSTELTADDGSTVLTAD